MTGWLLVARLALAMVFIVSGAAKLSDRAGTRQAVAELGVPARIRVTVAVALPGVELLVAAALLAATTAAVAGFVALGLLAAFSVAVAISLARGRRPPCHCFGQVHAAPIGARTLLRNLGLAVLAAFTGIAGWPHGGASLGAVGFRPVPTLVVIGALAVALAAMAALVVLLLGRYGQVLRRLDELDRTASAPAPSPAARAPGGLPVGTPAPDFALPGMNGDPLTLAGLREREHPVLLVFGDPACQPCRSLLPDLAHWQSQYADQFTVGLISRGDMAANRAEAAAHGLRNVGVQQGQEVSAAYRYGGTPCAVAVTPDGRIASPMAAGPDAIRSLVANLLWETGSASPRAARRGEPAPAVELADLDGQLTALPPAADQAFLLLFWNPGCGFCQQALGEVKARESGPLDFVFVSAGDPAANRAMELTSRVLLDPDFATARAFGASGTPSAILVGPDGRIASHLAVGAPAVLHLADEATGIAPAPAHAPAPAPAHASASASAGP